MEPENEPVAPGSESSDGVLEESVYSGPPATKPEDSYRGLKWVFIGDHGLRAGWSVALFLTLVLRHRQRSGRDRSRGCTW